MTEDNSQEKNIKSHESRFGYLRNRYTPHRETAQDVLNESGINPDSSEFKSARRRFARKLLETQAEGEVDSLTGLLNEKGFRRRFREESERIKRSGISSTMLFIDANNLKLTNDTLGHEAGNELLIKIASTLTKTFRTTDILARLHGDEYAAILVGIDLENLSRQWEERISKILTEEGLSIAIGASNLIPGNYKESLDKADNAMYKAKKISKQNVRDGERATVSSLVAD